METKAPFENGQVYYYVNGNDVFAEVWDEISERNYNNGTNNDKQNYFSSYQELFDRLLLSHDWYHEYSDSHDVWFKGTQSWHRIVKLKTPEYIREVNLKVGLPSEKIIADVEQAFLDARELRKV